MARGHFVTLQARGVFAFPRFLRERYHLDKPGTQLEIVEREDGVLELHPHIAVPADQTWFWTERWQRMEREVDEHVARGETTVHESTDDFLQHLERAGE